MAKKLYHIFSRYYLVVKKKQLYFVDKPNGTAIKPPPNWIIGGLKEPSTEKTFFAECLRSYKNKYKFKDYKVIYVGESIVSYLKIDVDKNKHKYKHKYVKKIKKSQI